MIFSENILSMEIFLEWKWVPLMPDNFTRQEEIAGVQWVKQICLSNGMHCLTVYLSTRLGQLGGGGGLNRGILYTNPPIRPNLKQNP